MLLFYAKTIVKESRKFELARLKKKKKKEKRFGCLATFWFGTFAMLFSATGCVVASFPGLHAQLLSLAVRKTGEGLDGLIT